MQRTGLGPNIEGILRRLRRGAGARRTPLALLRETRGATAVEFALIAPPFFLTVMFLIAIGYMVFMQEALDYATQRAARQIRTGQTQTSNIQTASAFAAQTVCPQLPSLFNCNNIIVSANDFPTNVSSSGSYPSNVYTSFINSSNTGLVPPSLTSNNTFCPGAGSYYVFLQILYPVPFFLSFLSSSSIATNYNGQNYYMIMSTAVFLNEPFTASASC
jgi:Flp pilus assembly protein TadG